MEFLATPRVAYVHLAFCRTPGVHSHFWQAPWFALWTCTPAPTTLSTELLATPTPVLFIVSSILAL